MEQRDLNRMFDALAPTAEQEREGLGRLLQTERKGRPMKKLKKLAVVGIAAALMVISCAAAAMTGIDQRLLEYFGVQPGQEERLAAAVAVGEPVAHSYPSGWTVQVGQVLADRYMITAVLDFTTPPDIDLSALVEREGEFELLMEYSVEDRDGVMLGGKICFPGITPERLGGWERGLVEKEKKEVHTYGVFGRSEVEVLESSNLKEGRLSVMWSFYKGSEFIEDDILGGRLRLSPKGLWFKETKKMLYLCGSEEKWTYEAGLPESDPGRQYAVKVPIRMDGKELEVQKIYLSPLELACYIYYPFDWDTGEPCCFLWESEEYTLNLSTGDRVSMKPELRGGCVGEQTPESCWELYCVSARPEQLVDPEQITSVTLYGQTCELK